MQSFLILIFSLAVSETFAKNTRSLASLMADKTITSVDLDGDKRPDYFKTIKDGKLTQIVFKPTRNPGFKAITKFKSNQKGYLKTTYFKKSSPLSQEEYSVHKNYSQRTSIVFKKEKKITRYYKNESIVKSYKWKKNKWKFISKKRQPTQVVTTDTAMTQPKPSDEQAEATPLPLPDLYAFQPGDGCNDIDKREIQEATGYLFDVMLKCLEKYNTDLVIAVAQSIVTHRNEIQCNKRHCEVYHCSDPKKKSPTAFTTLEKKSPIYLDSSTPSLLKKNKKSLSEQQRVLRLARTLLHEMLHKVLGTRHSKENIYDDAVYSCPFLCDTTQAFKKKINPKEACNLCEGAEAPVSYVRTPPLDCSKTNFNVFKNISEAYPPSSAADQLFTCIKAQGTSRNYQCWCEKYKTHFDPTNHICD